MSQDPKDSSSPDEAPSDEAPDGAMGTFAAMGYLLVPSIGLEVAGLSLFSPKYSVLGLVLFPLALSWFVISVVRVAKLFRA